MLEDIVKNNSKNHRPLPTTLHKREKILFIYQTLIILKAFRIQAASGEHLVFLVLKKFKKLTTNPSLKVQNGEI